MIDHCFKGSLGEYKAAIWLMEHGVYVYKNLVDNGPADLIALDKKTGKTVLIDVKNQSVVFTKADGTQTVSFATKDKRREGIHLLYIVDGEVVGFLQNRAVDSVYWPFS